MTKHATWLALLAVGLASGCSSDDNELDDVQSVDAQPETDSAVTTIPVPAALDAASRAYRFDYAMPAVTSGDTVARAQLFEPAGDAPDTGFPLVVWAHGTTGIANACAPSLSFEQFGNEVAIDSLLSAGYAVLLPDYEGFGTPSIHPYYVRSSHANAVLAAVPAAHRLDAATLSADWAIVGHSQGGHVALATARAEALDDYPLRAVAALAPGTDLAPISDRAFEAIDLALAEGDLQNAAERTFYMNLYGAFIAQAVQLVDPSFDAASLFGEDIAPLVDTAADETRCGEFAESVERTLSAHLAASGTLDEFGGLTRTWYEDPVIAARVSAEELGDEAQTAPLLIVQGDADRQIPIEATTGFVDRQRSLGTDVTYEVVSGGAHGDVARREFDRTIDWLAQRFPPGDESP